MAKSKGLCDRISELIKDAVEACGCTLWDVDFVKDGKDNSLVVYIDKPDGISLTDCETVNNAVDPIIDAADPIEGSYYLEISSPGLERELKTKSHLKAFIGKEIAVKFYTLRNGVKSINGILSSYDEENDVLELNGERIPHKECASIKSVCNF